MDYYRLVFDRLGSAAGSDEAARQAVYQTCRAEVARIFTDKSEKADALDALEKVIRRQEMQAIYEEVVRSK